MSGNDFVQPKGNTHIPAKKGKPVEASQEDDFDGLDDFEEDQDDKGNPVLTFRPRFWLFQLGPFRQEYPQNLSETPLGGRQHGR